MDLRMPAIDGIQATLQLLARADHPPRVLLITTFENDEYVYAALRAGASGFVLKRARPAQLVDAVRVVARGDSLLFPAAIQRLAGAYAEGDGATRLANARLNVGELDVLRRIAAGRSKCRDRHRPRPQCGDGQDTPWRPRPAGSAAFADRKPSRISSASAAMQRCLPARRRAAAIRVVVSLTPAAGVGARARIWRASGLARLMASPRLNAARKPG
jgi:hypothetical protein